MPPNPALQLTAALLIARFARFYLMRLQLNANVRPQAKRTSQREHSRRMLMPRATERENAKGFATFMCFLPALALVFFAAIDGSFTLPTPMRAAAPGGSARVTVVTALTSVSGRYECNSLIFRLVADSTVKWPIRCEDRKWGDKLSVPIGTSAEAPIVIKGHVLVPATAVLGPAAAMVIGSLAAPKVSGPGVYGEVALGVAVPALIDVVPPTEFNRRRRSIFGLFLAILMLPGALTWSVYWWKWVRRR